MANITLSSQRPKCVSNVMDNIILETPVTIFLNEEKETKGILMRKEGPVASLC